MRKSKLIVVVHAQKEEQAVRNARLAFDNGADGIFLINHDISAGELFDLYPRVRQAVGKDKFIGMNFLRTAPEDAARFISAIYRNAADPSALWLDDVGYRESERNLADRTEAPWLLRERLRRYAYGGLVFGGVDFKYRRPARDLSRATREVGTHVDVVTTSGPETGTPPTLEKILLMRHVLGDGRLAIASGMTPENVEPFLDLVDYFLVATGISFSHTELDPARVRQMADKMRR